MTNSDTRWAWRYHDGTKHPGGFLMSRQHLFDPVRQPRLFKVYPGLEPISLPLDHKGRQVAALYAISAPPVSRDAESVPDLRAVARLLFYSAGITKVIRFPWGDMPFRAAACTGALYHIELYLVCQDLPGLSAGVYHFDPRETVLRRLRQGDFRAVLAQATGEESAIVHAPATVVCTDVFWRNACKYQAREYRHAFWDTGTILANSLAMAQAEGLPARVVLGFVDEEVDHLLGLNEAKEAVVALLALGSSAQVAPRPPPEVPPLSLPVEPVSDYELDFPAIREMHQASSLEAAEEVASWRQDRPLPELPIPSGTGVRFSLSAQESVQSDPIEAVIVRRGSTRRFVGEAITFGQLSTILRACTSGFDADFLRPGQALCDPYLIANAVEDLPSGAYVYHRRDGELEQLRQGEFRQEAGVLGLQQALPADASANIYFLTDLAKVLERFGNRGYRAAQLEASISAGKVYLAAYALHLGATGLTFYDDPVTEFFSPDTAGKSAMFLVAVGKKAMRG